MTKFCVVVDGCSAGGNDLRGKTVGIVGTGTIGIATAKLFAAFGCKVVGWSRTEKEELKILWGNMSRERICFPHATLCRYIFQIIARQERVLVN